MGDRFRRFARAWVVLSLGLFALASQTLLFREFLTSFEGNELGIGCFFVSWLVWVALGAVAGRRPNALNRTLAARFAWLPLAYVPAFALQQAVIANARALCGVAAYELFPFTRMAAFSLVANAPISALSGWLFALACVWVARENLLPVARVYVLETLGGVAGGVAVTLLLVCSTSGETVFLLASLAVALATWAAEAGEGRPRAAAVPAAVLALLLLGGAGGWWARSHQRAAWQRLLPGIPCDGGFATAQGRYLYGEHEGQFIVVSWGGVSEALPAAERAGEVVALHMAQHPAARRILVVGPGSLDVCLRWLELPSVERVAWLHPDPEYPPALLRVLPERFRAAAARVELPRSDARAFLAAQPGAFDLVVLNLPAATTLVQNRYGTLEFYRLLERALATDGVVSTRLAGAANYVGTELAVLGASVLATVESVFARTALKPGDESWLLASNGDGLAESPALLRDRFAAIPQAAAVFPPDGLLSLYLPDRIAFQMEKYRAAAEDVPGALLRNTDRRPKALLYSLLVGLRQSGLSLHGAMQTLALGGVWIAAGGLLLFLLLRWLYLREGAGPPRAATPSAFDAGFLLVLAGLVGMSLGILLMYRYQARFGSIFLHIGLISALFMAGIYGGGRFGERLLVRRGTEPPALLPLCLLAHLLLIAGVAVLPGDEPRWADALLFVLAGVFTGLYVPIVAHRLHAAGRDTAAAGAAVELLDHAGGAVGAGLTGLVLLPVLGSGATLGLLAGIMALNLFPLLPGFRAARRSESADRYDRFALPAGYGLVGVAAFALLVSQVAAVVHAGGDLERLRAVAAAFAGGEIEERRAPLPDGSTATYFAAARLGDASGGYVFETSRLAPGLVGFGGRLVLAAAVADDGRLANIAFLRSHETPSYLRLVEPWLRSLVGRNLFQPGALRDIDTVSGATLTSAAVLRGLRTAGPAFAAEVLKRPVEREPPPPRPSPLVPDRDFLWLAALVLGAVLLRLYPGRWRRRAFLGIVLVVSGFLLNLQYSMQQTVSLLAGQLPGWALSASLFHVLLVPVLVLLFGNVYCGYLCPFGAAQELVGDLRHRGLETDPRKSVWRYGRGVKYLLLALLVVLFALTREQAVLSADPLITVFGAVRDDAVFRTVGVVLVLSFFFSRFWCRNLCPAGAFLSLLNRVRLLERIAPCARTRPASCDQGVRSVAERDCLCCDRCRHATR